MMPPKSPPPKAGNVFLLALNGVEIVYLPGKNEIVSRLAPAATKAPATADPPAKKKESKRQP